MKVKNLIKELQKLDQNLPVYLAADEHGGKAVKVLVTESNGYFKGYSEDGEPDDDAEYPYFQDQYTYDIGEQAVFICD